MVVTPKTLFFTNFYFLVCCPVAISVATEV